MDVRWLRFVLQTSTGASELAEARNGKKAKSGGSAQGTRRTDPFGKNETSLLLSFFS